MFLGKYCPADESALLLLEKDLAEQVLSDVDPLETPDAMQNEALLYWLIVLLGIL